LFIVYSTLADFCTVLHEHAVAAGGHFEYKLKIFELLAHL